jgi:hypothetical protein
MISPTMPGEADRAVAAVIHNDQLAVTLADGRVMTTPLEWYPRLQNAAPDQLRDIELGYAGIHFPLLDEDLSIHGMLQGKRVSAKRTPQP